MNPLLILCLLAFQGPGPETEPTDIWRQIAQLETTIKQAVAEDDSNFAISTNEPVQGYYVNRIGVFLVVPVRYRTTGDLPEPVAQKELSLPESVEGNRISRRDIENRIRDWQEKLNRSEMLKDANFEKVVSNMKALIPEVVATLRNLPQEESVIIVVEERVPAWFYAGFSLRKNATRKVVTLTVDKDLISHIDAQQTVLAADWLTRVKRTTTNRQLVSDVLNGSKKATAED